MTSYNLKAKNRETNEIVEYKTFSDQDYEARYITENNDILSNDEFNTLYEVISDTQEGWREWFAKMFGYERNGNAYFVTETSEVPIMDFIESVYKQGQADAYEKCINIAKGNNKIARSAYNEANADIAQAIEQLSSNKE